MSIMRLERHDNKRNMHRFYQITVVSGLFEEWCLIREWGRVGSPGFLKNDWFKDKGNAIQRAEKLSVAKQRKGYLRRSPKGVLELEY